MKPNYYNVLWHNCNRCKTHYTSEEPHLKAYLCDDCWTTLPHFKTQVSIAKRPTKKTGRSDYSLRDILLFSIGNVLCLGVIAYYLWFK